MTADVLLYLYAVGDDRLDPAGISGIGDAPVRVVVQGQLAAVVGEVGAQEFAEEPLAANLGELAWLEKVARAHHRVVAALADRHPVVPVRLATVFTGEQTVRALLRARRADIVGVLDRIRGRVEWGVKAFAAERANGEPVPPADVGPDVGPGAAYLMRRRAERDRRARGAQEAAARADELHVALSRHAVDARRHPPQDPRLSGRPETMVLNAAYLVEQSGNTAFQRELQRCDASLVVEGTGPWAPYSFATLDTPETLETP
ncbi:GvpL/GvpF family gas vesicle protein [Pseudonocardia sp.]|uniref:GvpL/GvpF family gas vesicle protein n=1 Tax=Pseudonocardia sp. TaxID=60912 RepID=UPI003D0CC089